MILRVIGLTMCDMDSPRLKAFARAVVLLAPCVLGGCGRSSPISEEQRAFQHASGQISSYDGRREAFGNTEEARALAGRFSQIFRQLREIGFSGKQQGMVTQGHFLTYGHVAPDRICLLVHVPLLRKFTQDAQRSLLDLAWKTASTLLPDRRGTRLGVGLRGVLLYDGVATGVVGEEPTKTFGPNSEKELYAFFAASPPIPVEAPPSVAAPPPATSAAPTPTETPRFRQISRQQLVLSFVLQLRSPDPDRRVQGLAGLRHYGREAAVVPDVARLLASDDVPEVRADAAKTLGVIGSPTAKAALERAVQDPDQRVREAVQKALGQIH